MTTHAWAEGDLTFRAAQTARNPLARMNDCRTSGADPSRSSALRMTTHAWAEGDLTFRAAQTARNPLGGNDRLPHIRRGSFALFGAQDDKRHARLATARAL